MTSPLDLPQGRNVESSWVCPLDLVGRRARFLSRQIAAFVCFRGLRRKSICDTRECTLVRVGEVSSVQASQIHHCKTDAVPKWNLHLHPKTLHRAVHGGVSVHPFALRLHRIFIKFVFNPKPISSQQPRTNEPQHKRNRHLAPLWGWI